MTLLLHTNAVGLAFIDKDTNLINKNLSIDKKIC